MSNRYHIQTNIKDDPCYENYMNRKSNKKLKYTTTNYSFDNCNPHNYDFIGTLPKDGKSGTAQCVVDQDTMMTRSKLTQSGFPQQLGSLPLSAPDLSGGCIFTDTESRLREGIDVRENKQCNPKDDKYYERTFYIFDHFCFDHAAPKNSIWPGCRGGMDTRQSTMGNYGCNSKR